MVKENIDWEPKGAMHSYRGKDIWEYNVAPDEVNMGEVDGDISFEDEAEADTDTDE